ncbi:FUSC family protein [Paeniglutamicibacter sp. R2-26]|uniref:FUSC family protein n=1 Tax=Paeniglutamicibacter sp. R2-26 TaxID=3144417 RepID=UPI003EE7BECE
MGEKFGGLLTLGPARDDHWIALRTGMGVFVPLLALLALGRLDLVPFVVFGAFTGVYGRVPGYANRLAAQSKAGGLFLAVILAAALSSTHLVDHSDPVRAGWMIVLLTTAVSGICAVAAGLLQLRPGGSLFHIFAFAAIASMPNQPPVAQSLGAALAVVLLAIVIGFSGMLVPGSGGWGRLTQPPALSRNMRTAIWWEAFFYLVAAGLAGSIATLLAPALLTGHSYWAMVAAVVPLVGHTTRHRVRRGIHRVLGTLTGIVLMAAIIAFQPPVWVLLVLVGLLQVCAELFIARNYFIAQIFVTPLALMGASIGTGLGTGLLYDRVLETLIGSAVGIAVVLLGSLFGTWYRRRTANPER